MKTKKYAWAADIGGPEDLPEPYDTIAELVGVESAVLLADKLGGELLYLPCLSTLRRQVRDRNIKKEFTGYNTRSLAKKHRISVQRVRQIVKDIKPKRQKPEKPKLICEQIRLF